MVADRGLRSRPVRLGRRRRKAFERKYGSPPDYTAAGCSASGQVLQAAVEKLGEPPDAAQAQIIYPLAPLA